jgi:hypothetical protein
VSNHSLQVIKRDGRAEDFDQAKIVSAVTLCFANGLHVTNGAAEAAGRDIRDRVMNIITHDPSHKRSWGVEEVQRLVIQQLWASGRFDAAEHYQNYRESRRKVREGRSRPDGEAELIAADFAHFGSDLRYYQFLSKYARWNEQAQRRETWKEACGRVMSFMQSRPQLQKVPQSIWDELHEGLYEQEATCAMRVLQMAGPALERCNVGAFNCTALELDCLEAFGDMLYILMQGCGVGFSVESDAIDKLPRVRKQKSPAVVHNFTIYDSTEGWCDAFLFGLRAWFAGEDVTYDTHLVRPAGARLRTKGGRASGPGPLLTLLHFARERILSRQGSRLRDIDCHDLACMTGKIVHLGGVRRAAECSVSDLDSEEMRYGKHGDWWTRFPMRDASNNSAVYNEKPSSVAFMREWLALAESGSGERGIFNRYAAYRTIPKRRKRARFLPNPCFEILLRSCQMCVSGDTPLITRDGMDRIGRLENNQVEVWNGKRWSEVTVKKTGSNQQLVRVLFSDGSHIDCTPDHRFSVSTGEDAWSEVQARDLKPRMATEVFKIQHVGGTPLLDAYTLGVLFGDGFTHRGNAGVDLFGDKIGLPISGNPGKEYLRPGYSVPCVRVNCGDALVSRLVSLRADEEASWQELFTNDRESILQFLAGWLDADGSCTDSGAVRLYVGGRFRADMVQLLLTKCGIRSSVNLMAPAGEVTNFGARKTDVWYILVTDCAELPCHRLDVSGGHVASCKGKFQTVRSVEYLPGLHDTFCFTEREEHKGVFNNTLTHQCNLSISVARHGDTEGSLYKKVRLATIWGTLQSTLMDFTYIRGIWRQNCEEERLLGVDITGQQDCNLLRYGAKGRAKLLTELKELALETNQEWAGVLGIPVSTAVTCGKPAGNSSQLFDCSSGISPRYSRYQVRRFRAGHPNMDPLSRFLQDQGVPCNVDPLNESLAVFDFYPEPAMEGTPTRNDLTAIQQLEYWLEARKNWAEHSISVTIYVAPEEWLEVGNWVYSHFDEALAISFLPKDGGTYKLTPNEELTQEEYEKRREAFPRIDWGKFPGYESDDFTTSSGEVACVGGSCEA